MYLTLTPGPASGTTRNRVGAAPTGPKAAENHIYGDFTSMQHTAGSNRLIIRALCFLPTLSKDNKKWFQ